jgi:hypothetical protein
MQKSFSPCSSCKTPKACAAAGKCLKKAPKSPLRGMKDGGMRRNGY